MENDTKSEVIIKTIYRYSPEKIEAHRQAVKRYQLKQGDEYLRYGREYSANYRIHMTEEQKEKQKSYGYAQYVFSKKKRQRRITENDFIFFWLYRSFDRRRI